MAVKRYQAKINVVEAARIRVINAFNTGLPIYLSFSGGKDSLCLADVVMKLIQEGKINPAQLTVTFIDEEAIYDCIEEKVKEWRKKFLLVGAKFEWYCVEVKHYNCFNQLTNDETFICWDHLKEDVWIRRPPSFAIRNHPLLKPRADNYQSFMPRRCRDGITLIGTRVYESVQRLRNIASSFAAGSHMNSCQQMFPIYDWHDKDVWLYLLKNKIDIPVVYLYLWQTGCRMNALRISQFFSNDTAGSLVQMNEYYPDLMEKICRREPNAYLAALYWDSEMFGRSTKRRKALEGKEDVTDYKAKLIYTFNNADKIFAPHARQVAEHYRRLFLKIGGIADNDDYKKMYEALMAGDPKLRSFRALYQIIYTKYIDKAKEEQKHGS